METALTRWDGRVFTLPALLSCTLEYTAGVPCDSFALRCLWDRGLEGGLADLVGFTAWEDGQRVFQGVVDECERGWDTAGGTLTVAGRGMAARLLDNEALGADYQVATVEDILRDHVAPYGIEIVRGAELPPVPGFSVDAGSSEWQVVYEFCRYYGGIAPRFDRLGRLVLAPWEEGRRLVLGADAAVTSFRLREQRYGVLSEVLVRDRTTEEVQRVADEDFLRRGGRCRRVLTMPGKSSYQAMRYSGAYQLARAREELRQAELELPEAFAAWPGELVELNLAKGTGRGLWRVRESVCGLKAAGTYTRLTLGEP